MATNNNAMYTELIGATNMMLGESAIDKLDLQGIVDAGKTWTQAQKEQWANELSARYVKTIYSDSAYTDRSNDVFYEDSAEFGAITQVIDIEMPEVIENRSWTAVTSGTTTIGANVVYLPVVHEQLFAGTSSWAVPIAFTGTQLNQAFESVQGLLTFNNYLRLMADNSIKYHKKVLNSMNRNNYIGEKIAVGNSAGKIHVVNLVEEYAKFMGVTTLDANVFYHTPDAMRYSAKIFKKFKDMLLEMSTLFTTRANSKGKFVPENRLVFQILSDFTATMDNAVYSGVFHDEFVKLPLYREVVAWQGLTDSTASADFEQLSSIDVTTSTGEVVSESGIVGLMVDKWAIMHTMVQNRVGVQRDDIKDITLNDYQFTDRYINNLSLPGIVFVVQDYDAEATE